MNNGIFGTRPSPANLAQPRGGLECKAPNGLAHPAGPPFSRKKLSRSVQLLHSCQANRNARLQRLLVLLSACELASTMMRNESMSWRVSRLNNFAMRRAKSSVALVRLRSAKADRRRPNSDKTQAASSTQNTSLPAFLTRKSAGEVLDPTTIASSSDYESQSKRYSLFIRTEASRYQQQILRQLRYDRAHHRCRSKRNGASQPLTCFRRLPRSSALITQSRGRRTILPCLLIGMRS